MADLAYHIAIEQRVREGRLTRPECVALLREVETTSRWLYGFHWPYGTYCEFAYVLAECRDILRSTLRFWQRI